MAYYRATWLPTNGQFSLACDHSQNRSTRTTNFVEEFHSKIRASYPTGTPSLDEMLKFCAAELTMAKTLAISFGNGPLKNHYIRSNKIPPVVTYCPPNIFEVSLNQLTSISWKTIDMLADNVGLVSVTSNFRLGQAFTCKSRILLGKKIDNSKAYKFPKSNRTVNQNTICDERYPQISQCEETLSCADCPAGEYCNSSTYECEKCAAVSYRSSCDPLLKCIPCPRNTATAGQIGQKQLSPCHSNH
uniref:Integrase catalytic domain-containing protein n=1 Tax=Heterorhabditis bacteriophora TaxID=37862 RepID=A0A1I7WPM6_HETBA